MGHAYSSIIADFFSRFKKIDGYKVHFLTGTDEHGLKIQRAAEKKGVETRPIISGNFLKQPSVKKYKLKINTNMKNADYINNNGFFIGLPTKSISSLIIKKLIKVFEQSA